MAIFSTLRSQRMTDRKTRVVEQIISFRLDKEWFALPILAIHKIIPLGKIYGDPQDKGISVTTYEEKELLVIDVAKQIFNQQTKEKKDNINIESSTTNLFDFEQQRYLLILQSEADNKVALPIDSQPTMHRVETTAFKTLPEAYLATGNIQCLSSQVIELPKLPPLFVLDPQKLIESIQSIQIDRISPLEM